LDDKCYQDTRAVLESVNVEIDQKLERRAFRDMLSKTAKKSLWVFFDIWNYLTMSWYQKSQDLNGADSFLFIPVSKANEAANLRTAQDIVISAGGGAVATITQKPSSTGIKGCVTNTLHAAIAKIPLALMPLQSQQSQHLKTMEYPRET
jgi:hypothetical protein